MKNLYSLVILLLFSFNPIFGQEEFYYDIEIIDPTGATQSSRLTYYSTSAGKHIYWDARLYVLLFDGSQWRIQVPGGFLFASAQISGAYPPDKDNGNWQRLVPGYELKTLSGPNLADNNGPLEVFVTVTDNVSCNGGNDGAAIVTARGGEPPYTYAWSHGKLDSGTTAKTSQATLLSAGTYSVTLTDTDSAQAVVAVTVTESPPLVVVPEVATNFGCGGTSNGSLGVSTSGGSEPYYYAWSTGATSANVKNLAVGDYSVTVTDVNNCSVVSNMTVPEPEVMVAEASVDASVSCNGASDGSVSVTASGDTSSYDYLWSNGAKTATVGGLSAGTYVVTVTDGGGCLSISKVTLTEPAAIQADASATDDTGNFNGTATVVPEGGSEGYTYLWNSSPVQTTATATDLPAGDYLVTITDRDGCTSTMGVTVKLVLAGDACSTAIPIDELLGGEAGTTAFSSAMDNERYPGKRGISAGDAGCFNDQDTLYRPMWFSFTGDGRTYEVKTSGADPGRTDSEIDTRSMLFIGECGDYLLIDCNDDESSGKPNTSLQVATREGLEYTVMIDAYPASVGAFRLAVTAMATTSIKVSRARPIALYPNPTAGYLSLAGIAARRVDVYDAFGRRLARHDRPVNGIELGNLAPGVYHLDITAEDGHKHFGRVMKR